RSQTTPGVCHDKSQYCALLKFTLVPPLVIFNSGAFGRTQQLSSQLTTVSSLYYLFHRRRLVQTVTHTKHTKVTLKNYTITPHQNACFLYCCFIVMKTNVFLRGCGSDQWCSI